MDILPLAQLRGPLPYPGPGSGGICAIIGGFILLFVLWLIFVGPFHFWGYALEKLLEISRERRTAKPTERGRLAMQWVGLLLLMPIVAIPALLMIGVVICMILHSNEIVHFKWLE